MLSPTFSLPESGAYAEDEPRLSTWLQRRKRECSVECSLSIPHCKFICLNNTNFHDNYISSGLKNLLWFSFFHPFSKIDQMLDRYGRTPGTPEPKEQGPPASWLPRQRNQSALGSSERPRPSIWTHTNAYHTQI